MYDTLSQLMPNASRYYGPVTKEQAFNVPHHSYAVPVGNDWYIGVNVELPEYAGKEFTKPAEPAAPAPAPAP